MKNILQNYWLLLLLGVLVTALTIWGMVWFRQKKYFLHFWLTALVGISTLFALLLEFRPRESAVLFTGINARLLGGSVRLDTSLYLYYMLIALAALVFTSSRKKDSRHGWCWSACSCLPPGTFILCSCCWA